MKNKYHWVALVLLAVFAWQVIGSMRLKSPSHDEYLYIGAGYSYYQTGEIQISFEHPPLMKYIAAFPLLFMDEVTMNFEDPYWQSDPKNQFGFSYQFLWNGDVDKKLFAARLPIALMGIALGLLLYVWAGQWRGNGAALFVLWLYTFSPNIITHSRFTTMDLGLTFFYAATMYAYWRYAKQGRRLWYVVTGLMLGLALGAKFSGVFLLPVLGILLFIRWQQQGAARLSACFRQVLLPYAGWLCITYLLLWALYLFPSNPLFYWDGMMEVYQNVNDTALFYLNGHFSSDKIPFYFVYCFLYKTPDVLLFLLLCALVLFFATRNKQLHDEAVLILPPVVLFVFTQAMAIDIGVRYLLPVYPFAYLFSARLVPWCLDRSWARSGLLILMAWYAMDTARMYPNYLAYFNQLSGGPEQGYKRLADSNLDWGQDLKLLAAHAREHNYPKVKLMYAWVGAPIYYGLDHEVLSREEWFRGPEPGVYVFSIAHLLEGKFLKQKFNATTDWLERYQYAERIGYSFYVFRFVDEEVEASE